MSVRLVFQDDKGNTLHEQDFTHEGAAFIPGQGDLVQIPGGAQLTVVSRQFVYPDSEHGQTYVRVLFVCKREESPASSSKQKLVGF